MTENYLGHSGLLQLRQRSVKVKVSHRGGHAISQCRAFALVAVQPFVNSIFQRRPKRQRFRHCSSQRLLQRLQLGLHVFVANHDDVALCDRNG